MVVKGLRNIGETLTCCGYRITKKNGTDSAQECTQSSTLPLMRQNILVYLQMEMTFL